MTRAMISSVVGSKECWKKNGLQVSNHSVEILVAGSNRESIRFRVSRPGRILIKELELTVFQGTELSIGSVRSYGVLMGLPSRSHARLVQSSIPVEQHR